MRTYLCPHCHNQFDTCSFCNGRGRVSAESDAALDASLAAFSARPKENLTNTEWLWVFAIGFAPYLALLWWSIKL